MDEETRAFEIFCAYYLGLSNRNETGFLNAQRTAQQWGWDVTQLMAYLQKMHMHPDQVLNTAYPLTTKRLDIEEVSLAGQHEEAKKMALQCYREFCNTRQKRDWLKEIEDEKREGNF